MGWQRILIGGAGTSPAPYTPYAEKTSQAAVVLLGDAQQLVPLAGAPGGDVEAHERVVADDLELVTGAEPLDLPGRAQHRQRAEEAANIQARGGRHPPRL
jgi:hypothetical protein